MRIFHSRNGWFNSGDDSETATVHSEATDENEVLVSIRSTADWKGHGDDCPGADVHLNPIDALELAGQIRQAVDALDSSVTETLP